MEKDMEIQKQENTYTEYIDNHRLNVEKAWTVMKSNNDCMNLITKYMNTDREVVIGLLDEMIKNHDMSKYKEMEFNAYRKEYYPVSPEEKEANKAAYDLAWKHHYHNNLHHWNWWYETGKMDEMKFPYVVEMICDWEAMGYHFGNNSKQYYEKNIQNIHLGDRQRKFAEELMKIVCK